jgi:ATP-dependent RNA helicase DDX19/DBP5
MSNEERDEYIEKFRNRDISTVITTNLLSRGLDIPEIQLVINFDVPTYRTPDGRVLGDPENYLHRIGRAGRFDRPGVALTLYDRDEDHERLQEIFSFFKTT